MLHILLFILKIIGIIIAVILGILLLCLAILLFVPIRYEVQGRGDGSLDSLKGKIQITWFLRLVRADVLYKNQKTKWRFRIAWLKKGNATSKKKVTDTNKSEVEKQEEPRNEEEKKPKTESTQVEIKQDQSQQVEPEQAEENLETAQTIFEESAADKKSEKRQAKVEIPEKEESVDGKKNGSIYKKILAWFQKIKCTFRRLCDKIKSLLTKKDKIELFLQDKIHQGAYQRCKKELFRLFRHLRPKKADVRVIYGFEEPYYTGQVLAFLSMLYPFIGNWASITPDFEKQILKGTIYMKGKIYLCHFVQICWNLFWDKNVRKTYHDIREFHL